MLYRPSKGTRTCFSSGKGPHCHAPRHYPPEHVWHLTQRCHRRQFLVKVLKDRRRWIDWLYTARMRFGLCVLDYTATSNHIRAGPRCRRDRSRHAARCRSHRANTVQRPGGRRGAWTATVSPPKSHTAENRPSVSANRCVLTMLTWSDGPTPSLFPQARARRERQPHS